MAECVSRQEVTMTSIAYNVDSTELAVNQDGIKSISITVVFPNDTQHCFKLNVSKSLIKN